MSDERESPDGPKPRRGGILDPSALMEESELPASPPPRRKTAVAEPVTPAETSGSTQLFEDVSFSTFSTDGGSDGGADDTTKGEGLSNAGGTISITNLVLGGEVRGYVLEDRLGEGTFAEVFRARHSASGRTVALKILRRGLAFDEGVQRRVLREGEILRSLRHPNLVEVYEVGLLEDGRAFIAMEVLRGRTLRALLQAESPLSPDRAYRLTESIADGLQAVHAAGIVHRDLKPANIFVLGEAPNERVKLLDFGLARLVDRGEFTQLTRAGDLIGSPGFMAPEQIRNPADADARADLYALGVTAYAMIMGKLPFVGRTHDVLKAQVSSEPSPLPALGGFERLVAGLMSKDPDARPNSAAAFIEQMHGVAEPTSVASTTWPRLVVPAPDPALDPAHPAATTSRAVLGLVLALALALLAVSGVFLVREFGPRDIVTEPRAALPPPAPRVTAPPPAPTVEVEPEVEPEVEAEAPVKEARATRPSRSADQSDRKSAVVKVRPELKRALRARGLRLDDARLLLPKEPALDSSTLPRESVNALLEAVARAELTKPLLRGRMTRLLGKLEDLSKIEPAPAELSGLEARYFRAREAVASVGDQASALERLNLQIEDLESALDRAKGN